MNSDQMAQQIRYELNNVVWSGGSAEVVFGTDGVYVFAGAPTAEQIPPGFPWCLVGVGSGSADEDHPEFITQSFTLNTAAEVAGDPLGEHAMIGGSVSELGVSAGRGVLEVAERVRFAVQHLTGFDGAKVLLSLSSTDSPSLLDDGRHIVLHQQELEALCTSALHYSAPQVLAHAGGVWTWTGSHCSDRFDFKQYRLVHKTGAIPANPADGTTVYTGTPATFTGVATSGETYVAFADYSARKQTGIIEGSSDPEVGSYKAIS